MIVIRITDTPPQDWLAKAAELTKKLDAANDDDERRLIIKANQGHWGKLKKWLQDRTHGKCWYSEAKEIYSHYQVDHFRPKSKARELDRSERCGYWWLAFDWHNYRIMGSVGNPKKGDMFPLKPGTPCNHPAWRDCGGETYLLLDPTAEDDVSLVDFNEDGRPVPVDDLDDWEKMRAEKNRRSIGVGSPAAGRGATKDVARRNPSNQAVFERTEPVGQGAQGANRPGERSRANPGDGQRVGTPLRRRDVLLLKHNNKRLIRLVTAPRQAVAA